MVRFSNDKDKIEQELARFYRNSRVYMEELGNDLLFIIEEYRIRDTAGLSCRAALIFGSGKPSVLIDSTFDNVAEYTDSLSGSIMLGENKWYPVRTNYFWDDEKPAYWFVERNLTEFFRNRRK